MYKQVIIKHIFNIHTWRPLWQRIIFKPFIVIIIRGLYDSATPTHTVVVSKMENALSKICPLLNVYTRAENKKICLDKMCQPPPPFPSTQDQWLSPCTGSSCGEGSSYQVKCCNFKLLACDVWCDFASQCVGWRNVQEVFILLKYNASVFHQL